MIPVGRIQLLAAAALFSTGGAAIKAASFDGWQIAGMRSGVAALALLLLVPAARRGWHWRLLPVTLAYACTLTLFVLANRMTTAANAIFLQSTAPLYLILLGPLVLREPLRRSDLVFIGVLGLGLASFFVGGETPSETAPDPLGGNVLALLSGVSWAFTVLGLRWLGRRSERGESTLAAVTMGNALVFFVALPMGLPMALPLREASAMDWLVILYLGAIQIGLAYYLVTRGIQHVPALEASLLLLLEPALNPLWAWLFQDELPSAWAMFGGALILGATLLRTFWLARTSPAEGPGPPGPGVVVPG